MRRWILAAFLLAVLLASPGVSGPARAADVNVTLIAENVVWRVGTTTGPTITVAPGDVLRLRIENRDTFDHTFTATHFALNVPLPASATIFVNITTSTADNGPWQFYCAIPGHATGANESRTGMVGRINVGTTPPPTPGPEVVLLIAGIGAAAIVARVASRKGSKSK